MVYSFKQIHQMVMEAYLKAREEEREKDAQLEFELDLEANINALAYELYTRQWKPMPLKWFVLLFPSVREVFAPQFRDRIVSHVLFAILSPIFERYFIFDSHSCRQGKGTLVGIERFEHHIRSVTNNYKLQAFCLNIDISGYFMSIVRSRLYDIIWKTLGRYRDRFPEYTDYDFVDYLISTFLFRDPLEGCIYVGDPALKDVVPPGKSLHGQPEGTGVPIGDVINQLNSNIYMNPFDQFVKRELKIRGYDRYVDDARVLHNSYQYLEECKERCGEFLDKELSLKLHPRKTTITDIYDTNYFLGAAILPYRRYAVNKTMSRFDDFIEALETDLKSGAPVDLVAALTSLNSRLGYLQHFDEKKAISKAIMAAPTVNQYFIFTPRYTKAKFKTQ